MYGQIESLNFVQALFKCISGMGGDLIVKVHICGSPPNVVGI
ncbi:hypothetical protein E0E64_07510 [Staphylococcus aureus]|nr:hypothetical protein E0E64_07510 [Staphylococcus aureus]TBV46540.1 hypothetical protein E0E65_07460 [Staphylococcus aureus]TBV56857.1 hypothetical protein E0E66_09170 [Staphylococcus aureus]